MIVNAAGLIKRILRTNGVEGLSVDDGGIKVGDGVGLGEVDESRTANYGKRDGVADASFMRFHMRPCHFHRREYCTNHPVDSLGSGTDRFTSILLPQKLPSAPIHTNHLPLTIVYYHSCLF